MKLFCVVDSELYDVNLVKRHEHECHQVVGVETKLAGATRAG